MLAFALSILLFIFLTVVGHAVLVTLHKQDNLLQNMLLAPVVGLATTILPIFWLNSAGIPVAHFGWSLAAALWLGSLGLLWYSHPKLPWRDYLPFASLLVLALVITGRPMLEFGFDWISYSNLDMTALYSSATQRFLNNGYFAPQNANFFEGRDYTQWVWDIYVNEGLRSGSELLLAWVISLTGLTVYQNYMPVLLAVHLVLISTVGAMIYQSSLFRLAALLTLTLLSFSPLITLPTLYQLTPQVGGIAFLAACVTVLLRPLKNGEMKVKAAVKQGILIGILTSGLFLVYNELVPFLILAFFLYVVLGLLQRRLTLRSFLPILIPATLILLTLHRYLINRFAHFLLVLPQATKAALIPLFPYYLIPSGLANFWGFQSIGKLSPEPWLSISIALGGSLLLISAISALSLIKSGHPAPIITTIMLALGTVLFINKAAFGLFKLAMIIQPFMISSIVIFWIGLFRQRSLQILPLFLIGLLGLPTQFSYVEASRGFIDDGRIFTEIPNASSSKIYSEFQQLISSTNSDNLILDTSNPSLIAIQAFYTRGKVAVFPSLSFHGREDILLNFNLHNKHNQGEQNKFIKEDMTLEQSVINSTDALLIATTPQQGLFNRWHFNSVSSNFITQPLSKVYNQLIFIRSQLGNHYSTDYKFGSSSQASFYQLEPDFFLPGRTIAGIGRNFLFQVFNPSAGGRLVLNMTGSLKNDGENKLPPADAIGTERQSFPMIGRGSARVFSPPIIPQVIAGRTYLGIDMGIDGQAFSNRKTGLMKLYGTDILSDQRKLVGYGRDISLISNEEYLNIAPPNNLSTFPANLTNPNLEYSGLYEDGWVSEAAFLGLTQPNTSSKLTVRGMIPKINDPTFTSELRVLVDEQEVAKQMVKPGEFNFQTEVPRSKGRKRIDLRFSKFQHLQAPDNRPVAAKLKFIGFAD